MLWDLFLDAAIDSLKMLPFLFLAYWLIEYIERRHSSRIEKILASGGRFGFAPGAVLGLVPQCGFSAMAANLYGSRVITLGTLLAVFLATSDEAIPLMLASPDAWRSLLPLLGVKLLVALLAGFLVDFVLCRFLPESVRGGYAGGGSEKVDCHSHETVERDSLFGAACKHTLHIFIYIFIFNLALGALVSFVGEETIAALLKASGAFQPLLAGLIGLIPNCASSILLTQLYTAGQITFGSVVAGLCTGAGVGLAVLLRVNKSAKQNLFIIGLLYALGVAAGMICGLFV